MVVRVCLSRDDLKTALDFLDGKKVSQGVGGPDVAQWVTGGDDD